MQQNFYATKFLCNKIFMQQNFYATKFLKLSYKKFV